MRFLPQKRPSLPKILLAIVLFGGLIMAVWKAPHPLELYRTQPLPDMVLTSLTGETIHTQPDWQNGEPYVLNIFASWCGPCREEMPQLKKLGKHIRIYGLAVSDTPEDIKRLIKETGDPYTAIGLDNGSVANFTLRINALPTTLFVDSSGRISAVHYGGIDAQDLKETFLPMAKHLY